MQYLKVKQQIQQQINNNNIGVGDKLMSERNLAQQLNTTRITLREALFALELEGKIYRQDRRGWFVTPPALIYNPTKTSNFYTLARNQGRAARTELLDAQIVSAESAIAELLRITVGSPVAAINRVRFLDDRPVVYVTHYVLLDYFPNLLNHDLSLPLTDIYHQHYGILYQQINYQVRSSIFSGAKARAIRAAEGAPALQIQRVNFDQFGRLLDCDIEHWRHDAVIVAAHAEQTANHDIKRQCA